MEVSSLPQWNGETNKKKFWPKFFGLLDHLTVTGYNNRTKANKKWIIKQKQSKKKMKNNENIKSNKNEKLWDIFKVLLTGLGRFNKLFSLKQISIWFLFLIFVFLSCGNE